MKTVALEEIHREPGVLDRALDSGEEIAFVRAGQTIGRYIPEPVKSASPTGKYTPPDFMRRLIDQYGPDAFKDAPSVQELFDVVREDRRFL